MKKLFIQFYLLLFVCFLVMSLLVGLVYKFTAERAGKQSLDDLMNSSLYLMRSELREIPPHDWGKTLKEMDLNLSFDLRVEPLSKYHLDDISMHRLRGGEIVAQRQQLCARDMAHCVLVRLPHVHSLCLFRVQQTDGGCGLDLLYHKCLSLYLLLHHLMITDIFCSSKMTFRYFRVRSKRQVFSLSKSG